MSLKDAVLTKINGAFSLVNNKWKLNVTTGDQVCVAKTITQDQIPIVEGPIYTVPALTQTIVTAIHLTNTTGSDIQVTLYANDSGATYTPTNAILYNETVTANSRITILGENVLSIDGGTIGAVASAAGVSVTLFGVECTDESAFVPGAIDHGALAGLLDDDHPQYLLTNGQRTLTGDLNLGSNSITNVDTINGIDANLIGTALQPGDNITELNNNAGFETPIQLNARDVNNRDRANHTGTQTASTISDFDTEVSNNPDVVANTAKVSADGSIDTHSDVDTTTTPPASFTPIVWNGTDSWVPVNAIGANSVIIDKQLIINAGSNTPQNAGIIVNVADNSGDGFTVNNNNGNEIFSLRSNNSENPFFFIKRDDGTTTVDISSTGIRLNETGTRVQDFSTDGTLSTDSDTTVSTQRAVKTYVDTQNATQQVEIDNLTNKVITTTSGIVFFNTLGGTPILTLDLEQFTTTTPALDDFIVITDTSNSNGERRVLIQDLINLVPGAPVSSVNGQVGAVVLTADDITETGTRVWFTPAEQTKLAGIETGAQVNQTDAQIKVQYENNADTNAFTDAEKSKLAALESSKYLGLFTSLLDLQTAFPNPNPGSYGDVDPGVGSNVTRYIWDSDDNQYIEQLGEASELTDAQIKTKYENNPDTNAFTDSEQTKLSQIAVTQPVDLDQIEIDVSQNVTDITNIQTEQITQNDDISQNTSDIAQNVTDIGQNASNLAQEITDRTNADLALQAQIDTNDTDISNLQAEQITQNNNISQNTSDIAQEIIDRTAADATLQSQIDTNDTDILNLQNNKADQTTAINTQVNSGLSGGGDLSVDRDLELDLDNLPTGTPVNTDEIVFVSGGVEQKGTIQQAIDSATVNGTFTYVVAHDSERNSSATGKLAIGNGSSTATMGFVPFGPGRIIKVASSVSTNDAGDVFGITVDNIQQPDAQFVSGGGVTTFTLTNPIAVNDGNYVNGFKVSNASGDAHTITIYIEYDVNIQGFQGPKGDQGDAGVDGNSVVLTGMMPPVSPGPLNAVFYQDNGDQYVTGPATTTWSFVQNLRGPVGASITTAKFTNTSVTNIQPAATNIFNGINPTPLLDQIGSDITVTSNTITINTAGVYEIYFNLFVGTNVQRANAGFQYVINGTPTGRLTASNYVRSSGGHNEASTNLRETFDLSATDTIQIQIERLGNTGTVNVTAGQCLLEIRKLS